MKTSIVFFILSSFYMSVQSTGTELKTLYKPGEIFRMKSNFFTKFFYIQVLNPLAILKMKQIENSSRRKMRVKPSKVLYAQILFGP